MKKTLIASVCGLFVTGVMAQRIYSPSSVLSTGSWYKIAVPTAAVYKVNVAFLSNLGINTSNLRSSSIRLYGNGGKMLPENNILPRYDDLIENAIKVEDGGDGLFDGNDYFLFYADGPDEWIKDSINNRFTHRKNIFSGVSYYYINIAETGKRIQAAANPGIPNHTVQSYNYRYFYETDTINFLNSGKEWYGEEFANAPGKTLSRSFNIDIPDVITGSPVTVITNLVARSINAASNMAVALNGALIQTHHIPSVGAGVYDQFVFPSAITSQSTVTQNPLQLAFNYSPGSFNAQAWLNWFEIHARSSLNMLNRNQLAFRDWSSVGSGNIARFVIQNPPAQVRIWEITDPVNIKELSLTAGSSDVSFVNDASMLREYIAFTDGSVLVPQAVGRVANQDLHKSIPLDYIIVTNDAMISEAERLAAFHRNRGLRVGVFSCAQVYNEFSGGSPDPTAIRDFVKMYFDKASNDSSQMPKYLLLLGSGSFDYRNRTGSALNLVPVYESTNSTDPLATYTSDDFFGLLNDNDDISNPLVLNRLDIGVGRIPARNATQAKNAIDKVLAYHSAESYGPWRNYLTFVADDEDNNLHLNDAEIISNAILPYTPTFNYSKIYLDAFQQESGSGGSRYPAANAANNSRLFNGTLIWNYSGHGGYNRLAEEAILDQDAVNALDNANRLPLFITATCDFAPYDNPVLNSLGENLLLREKTGAIALMTTTRPVFAFSNRIMNNNYLLFALQRNNAGKFLTLGEAMKLSKNYTYTTGGDVINTRKFALLGDPAMKLGFPEMNVRVTKVNGHAFAATDTLQATNKYTIEGEVTDRSGNLLNDFNGNIYPVIFDKPQQMSTLGNDPGSYPQSFTIQSNVIYKGKSAVQNGQFSFSFIVPRDINYQFGNGKMNYYAENGLLDAAGTANILVGGIGNGGISDHEGPVIKPYLNDDKFANGGLTNENPVLLVKLYDSSGINTTGTGIGHDITAILDGDNRNIYKLNDFYQASANSYQQGVVRFPLTGLSEGPHTLRIKAWDVLNNSNEATLDFRVQKESDFNLAHVLNYPNPFTTKTTFWFEHNRPGEQLTLTIKIMTVTGRVVKNIRQIIFNDGNRSCEVEWDGTDDYGNKLARGVYIYSLSVRTSDGKSKYILQKLAIL
jgi:hypothetical protein